MRTGLKITPYMTTHRTIITLLRPYYKFFNQYHHQFYLLILYLMEISPLEPSSSVIFQFHTTRPRHLLLCSELPVVCIFCTAEGRPLHLPPNRVFPTESLSLKNYKKKSVILIFWPIFLFYMYTVHLCVTKSYL